MVRPGLVLWCPGPGNNNNSKNPNWSATLCNKNVRATHSEKHASNQSEVYFVRISLGLSKKMGARVVPFGMDGLLLLLF